MDIEICHTSGAKNFEVASVFLENNMKCLWLFLCPRLHKELLVTDTAVRPIAPSSHPTP